MSLAVLRSRALSGMEALAVNVEVHLANGLPSFTIVGLPDAEVRESKDRVRAALQNAGFDVPSRRITVNLAPADVPKESGRFDLPIALGILAASEQIPAKELGRYEFAGELSLSGQLRPVHGALAMTIAMQRSGGTGRAFILPMANADEAALVPEARIHPAETLLQVCAHFAARDAASRLPRHVCPPDGATPTCLDFADVKGQDAAKKALVVAACGGHNVLLIGPPGAGKTMLAARLPGLMPPMSDAEALEAAAVQSLGGAFLPGQWKTRPFRSPHHTTSGVALVGGGAFPRPGEISLAHCGVLFLDELPEFDRRVLEVLRQPLESGTISISRAASRANFPARFQLVAAMNPCACGYLGHPSNKCRCTREGVLRYQGRLSGPLLDRFDLLIEVNVVKPEEMSGPAEGEPSAALAARVASACARQHARQGKTNVRLGTREIDRYCKLDKEGDAKLREAMEQFHWSGRAYHRVLKVARSIADLAGAADISVDHIGEAIQYRRGLREP